MQVVDLFQFKQAPEKFQAEGVIWRGGFYYLTGDMAQLAREGGFKVETRLAPQLAHAIHWAVNEDEFCNDWKGVFWDICTMKRFGRSSGTRKKYFQVIITGLSDEEGLQLAMLVGPKSYQDPTCVVTIGLANEIDLLEESEGELFLA